MFYAAFISGIECIRLPEYYVVLI